jgi:two-component system cell cycle response regulator
VKILIADDDSMARRLLGALLERLGHQVVAVENGRQALEALGAPEAPRVWLLDWDMPELDGVAVCRQLRAQPAERYTHVTLLTGKDRPEDLVAGLDAGADDFLVKPVNPAELRARLNAAERILGFEEQHLRSRAYLAAILAHVTSGILLSDARGAIAYSNPAFDELPGPGAPLPADRRALLDRWSRSFDDAHTRELLAASAASTSQVDAMIEVAQPERRVLHWRSQPVHLPDGVGHLDVYRDATREMDLTHALVELTETLKGHAGRDPLTGLLNRRGAEQAMARERARARRQDSPLAVALIDVDHFKRVNDQYGHEAGDRVLRAVGRAIENAVRPYDVVARWGGEEFLMVIPGATVDQARTLAERLRQSVADLRPADLPAVTVSIGVDILAPGEETLAAALARADTNLYQAKNDGRNRVR